MARRLPSLPPALPGFSFVRILGSGGFADVFLFEQDSPRRQVAVKVMLSEYVNVEVRRMFQAEADLMAQLSAHPAILTIYQSGVASDGRPYLVMELCSATIGETYRESPLSVPEALRVGIKIASAVETAHRSGVLHRDIKPANILMTAYGNPVLSDFGIAGTLDESVIDDTVGMSIPWSAPEVLHSETNGTISSEVFSLGATTYSLLAGRAPFEVPNHDNSSASLISRANRGKPAPIGRPDLPESLERVLARSMSRRPEHRQQSAMEFIHELQSVEAELGFAQTQPDVATHAWSQAAVGNNDDRTRVEVIRSVDPGRRRRRSADDSAQRRGATRAVVRGTGSNSASDRHSAGRVPLEHGRAFVAAIVTCSILVVLLAVATVFVVVRTQSADTIPAVTNVAAEVGDSGIVFTWADPGLASTDSYQIRTGDGAASVQKSTEFTIDAAPGERACITVRVTRDGALGPASSEKCVDVPGEAGG